MSSHLEVVQPADWPRPRGYANGIVATGRTLYIAGQIGWNAAGDFPSTELAGQFDQALANVVEVVRAAGGQPTDLCKMTVFVTDVAAYRGSVAEIGAAWRRRLGKHFPAMALVGVTELVEPSALVEIEAIACLAEDAS